MDAGTNALDILTGRVYPLKLGFIGVVNRSQQDINTEKSMQDALEAESEFFKSHPAYRNIAHKNGTRYLARSLNQVSWVYIDVSENNRADVNDIGSYEPHSRKIAGYEGQTEHADGSGSTGVELFWRCCCLW